MKKSVFFTVLMVILMIAAGSVFAQKSKAYSGDKSPREIKKSKQIFQDLIKELKEQKSDLEKSRERLVFRYLHASSGNEYFNSQIIQADSLIGLYQQKIAILEDQQITFLINANSKDQQDFVDLRGRDPNRVADAYVTVKYAQAYVDATTTAVANSNSTSRLVGIVANEGYLNPVVVKITGPANFALEFTLGAKQKSPEFFLPCPGNYTATFTSSYGVRQVTKQVGPNVVYYDGNKPIDFKATLLP